MNGEPVCFVVAGRALRKTQPSDNVRHLVRENRAARKISDRRLSKRGKLSLYQMLSTVRSLLLLPLLCLCERSIILKPYMDVREARQSSPGRW